MSFSLVYSDHDVRKVQAVLEKHKMSVKVISVLRRVGVAFNRLFHFRMTRLPRDGLTHLRAFDLSDDVADDGAWAFFHHSAPLALLMLRDVACVCVFSLACRHPATLSLPFVQSLPFELFLEKRPAAVALIDAFARPADVLFVSALRFAPRLA